MGGRLGEGRAPLAGAGLGGDGGQSLLGRVVGLGQSGVQLVGAGGVVALELVEDLGRGAERLLEVVGTAERGGTIDLVHLADALGDIEEGSLVVELLLAELFCEDRGDMGDLGFDAVGEKHAAGLVRHVRTHVIPLGRDL